MALPDTDPPGPRLSTWVGLEPKCLIENRGEEDWDLHLGIFYPLYHIKLTPRKIGSRKFAIDIHVART